MDKTFLQIHKDLSEHGFWEETYKSQLIRLTESNYKNEVIKEWGICDIVINGDKVLLKWYKRHRPLTDEEITKIYGR